MTAHLIVAVIFVVMQCQAHYLINRDGYATMFSGMRCSNEN